MEKEEGGGEKPGWGKEMMVAWAKAEAAAVVRNENLPFEERLKKLNT